jgi:hypothetical protein
MESKSSVKSQPSGTKSKENKQLICQNCKFFRNKPGWCNKKKEHTARKATCRYFERRKK